jgi:hypothetical protein
MREIQFGLVVVGVGGITLPSDMSARFMSQVLPETYSVSCLLSWLLANVRKRVGTGCLLQEKSLSHKINIYPRTIERDIYIYIYI